MPTPKRPYLGKANLNGNYPVFRCEECIRINGRWVHLRISQTCGKMLCCDSSEHQHYRRHYEETGHPVISSAELGEQWLWCFLDQQQTSYQRAFPIVFIDQ